MRSKLMVRRWLVLLLLVGSTGCVGAPEQVASAPAVTATASLVVSVKLGADRRVAAVASDVEQVVVEVSSHGQEVGPKAIVGQPSGQIRHLDKAALSGGTAQVGFSGLTGALVTVRMTALNGSGRVIGFASGDGVLVPGQTQQMNLTLQLEPTVTSAGTGGLTPTVTFSSPLPQAGTVAVGPAIAVPSYTFLGFDASGALCIQDGNKGFQRFDAQGTKLGAVQFQPAVGDFRIFMDASGHFWGDNSTAISRYGPDGQRIAQYPLTGLQAVDPANNAWVTKNDGSLTRLAPDGANLGTHVVLQGDEQWRSPVFDAQSGAAWLVADKKLIKVSPAGERQLTVTFPPADGVDQWDVASEYLRAAVVDRDGQVWVARQDGYLFKVSPAGQVLGKYPAPINTGWLVIDKTDHLWAVSQTDAESNLTKFTRDGVAVGQNGLTGTPATVRLDPQGVLWFLVNGATTGLARLTP